ncbi:hypothetical protein DFH27DRAFT_50967 [Peziza echinospora]|nr:hypothetical protein DFH27DRAFT_50967 [Peziza echinospora]
MSTIRGASKLQFEPQNKDPLAVTAVIIELTEKSIECINSRGAPQGYGRKIASELVNILSLLKSVAQTKLSPNGSWPDNSQDPGALTFRLLVGPNGPLLQLQWFLRSFLTVLIDGVEEAEIHAGRVVVPVEGGLETTSLPFVWVLRKQKVRKLLGMMEKYRTCLLLALQNDHIALAAELNAGEVYTDSEEEMDIDDEDPSEEFRSQSEGPLSEVHQKERILEWLSPLDFQARQKDTFALRLTGTGSNFLEHEIFRSWVMGAKKTLYCPGIPGSGKTVIVSTVVNLLEETFSEDPEVGIAYFYCDHAYREQEQSAVNITRSLLQQLAFKHAASISGADAETLAFLDSLMTLYETADEKPPTFKQCMDMLRFVLTLFPKVFIIIDGIDECDERNILIPELVAAASSRGSTSLSLIVSSRDSPEISEIFSNSARLEVRASDADIRRYVEHRIDRSRNSSLGLLLLDPGTRTVRKVPQAAIALRRFITDRISKKAQGT